MFLMFLVTSCVDTWSNVKRGLLGTKGKSTDEFLIQKKDPLILPPDFENLPTPDERTLAKEEFSLFEKKLGKISITEDTPSSVSSTEESILQKIRKK